MNSFEKLLDTVRKSNPDLISEQAAQDWINQYNAYETNLRDTSFADGKAAGFEEGYREGTEKGDAICKQKMDELLAQCDEEATAKLEAIINTLCEDHANKLNEVYMSCCNNMVPMEDVQAMDQDHADKFMTAMEAVDKAHAKKMQMVYESVKKKANAECKAKLDEATNKYEGIIKESKDELEKVKKELSDEKERKIGLLTESVNKYLNYALANAIPTKKLVSEAKFTASQKALEKITSICKINQIVQESKDGIFQDYENKIKDAQNEQNKLMMENAELKDTLAKKEAKLLLESKITKCTPDEARFLRTYFNNAKSPKIIEEQIEDARAAYSRIKKEKRAEVVNKVKENNPVVNKASELVTENKNTKKNEPAKKVVTESAQQQRSVIDIYAEYLKTPKGN